MPDMDGWSLLLLAWAAYLAVVSLVRLMKSRYETVIGRLRAEWLDEQERKAQEEQRRRQEERKRRLRQQIQQQLEQASDASSDNKAA